MEDQQWDGEPHQHEDELEQSAEAQEQRAGEQRQHTAHRDVLHNTQARDVYSMIYNFIYKDNIIYNITIMIINFYIYIFN